MPMTQAVEGYDLFDKMKVQKGRHSDITLVDAAADRRQSSSKHRNRRGKEGMRTDTKGWACRTYGSICIISKIRYLTTRVVICAVLLTGSKLKL